ncbi:MAG: winged helix-turn-helix domain-containing protein [Candidatus Kariarchaeaceae archaeon]|jgi:DNA-binding MarR family transcriptional regulator
MKFIKQTLSQKFVISLVLLVLISGTTSRVDGVNYQFEEDFSDPNTDLWTFAAYNFSAEPFQPENNTFQIENGQLFSNGTFDGYTSNQAYIVDTTAFGAWSIDVNIPSTAEEDLYFDRLFAILMSDLKMGPPTVENSTHWGSFGFDFAINEFGFGAHNGTPNVLRNANGVVPMQFNQTQHYDLIRTTEKFYVFIDQTHVANFTLANDIGTDINYFTIVTPQGSNITFDNVKITTNATGLLTELGVSPKSVESAESVNRLLLFTIGAGTLGLLTGGSYYQIRKKKELAKLISISSNGNFSKVSISITQIFNSKKSLYFLFLGHRTRDINLLEKSYEASMTSAMQQYKHLLHPFRLSIIQLLYINSRLTSIEIKERLDLSWSDFYNSVRRLEKLKLIRVFDDFDEDGSTRQFVILEEEGKQQYGGFINLVGKIVDDVKDLIPDYDGTDLYP